MILIPPNKSERVSFKARETAKPPTPKAVISGVIDIPNDCKINKNPNEKRATHRENAEDFIKRHFG